MSTRRMVALALAYCIAGLAAMVWVKAGGPVAYPFAFGGACFALALGLHVRRAAR